MIQDLELKRTIIDAKTDVLVRQCTWSLYRERVYQDTGELLKCYGAVMSEDLAKGVMRNLGRETLRVCHNLNNSYYRRKKTLTERVAKMLTDNKCVFLTLTFTDETLANTSAETRRRYVTRYLKSQFPSYIANIDFGKENGREHYHAVITGKVDLKAWTYGAINAKNIINENSIALAKYITKITHHSLKSTNKQQRVIYSR